VDDATGHGEERAPAGQELVRLGHNLRNTTTVLFGLVDRLQDLTGDLPALAEVASDLNKAADQIQAVAQKLSRFGRSGG